jgi:hypothetical protein
MRIIVSAAVLAAATIVGAAAQTSHSIPPPMRGSLIALRLPPLPLDTLAGVTAHDIVGAAVRNDRNERVGRVHDFRMGAKSVDSVVVASGGMLGLGERRVELGSEQLTFARDGRDLVVVIAPAGKWVAQALTVSADAAAKRPEPPPEDRTTIVPAPPRR